MSSALLDSWEKISVASLLNESKLFYVREVGWFSRSAVIVIFAYWIWWFMMRGENSCLGLGTVFDPCLGLGIFKLEAWLTLFGHVHQRF